MSGVGKCTWKFAKQQNQMTVSRENSFPVESTKPTFALSKSFTCSMSSLHECDSMTSASRAGPRCIFNATLRPVPNVHGL